MRGKILEYDETTQKGAISGDDGNRYYFQPNALKEEASPKPGSKVDFEADGGTAVDIFVESPFSGTVSPKLIAALLGIFLGYLGAHKFYLGFTKQGITMLAVFLLGLVFLGVPSTIIALIGLIEGVVYLARSDDNFERLNIRGNRGWF